MLSRFRRIFQVAGPPTTMIAAEINARLLFLPVVLSVGPRLAFLCSLLVK